ncbi:nucleolin 2-like isoform X2 [Vicia villosa]|uniref:nucleolin 2-like isoform X2 n=1 Tax=Vicia villosa TaxID=3911 RepID=UPI00273C87A5|nr:nucleolin 2-like isoform X2 [Vicia villosa]
MDNESEPLCEDAIPPQKIGNKREYEDEDQKEVITKKKKRILEDKDESNSDFSEHDEKLKAEIESDNSCGSLESFDDGVSDPNSNEDNLEDLESPERNEEEVEGKVPKTPQERHGSPVTLNKNYAAPKTICVKNLSYSVERADMEDIFKDCGEVVDVQFVTDCEGRFRGFGFVKFGTVEAAEKALKLHNTKLLNRRIKVEIAWEKSEYPPYKSSIHTGGSLHSHTVKGFDTSLVENKPKRPATPNKTNGTSKTVYVGNLSYSVERADMEKLFKDYGEIVDVRLHTDREGKFKGHGHVQFATEEAAQKALAMNKKVFFERRMVVDLALERPKDSPNGSSWAWSSSFHKDERIQSQTVPMKCLDTSLEEGKLSCAKEVKDVEMFDAASAENKPETPATRRERSAASKRVCVRNLSFDVERAEIENIFKDCGVVVDVRLHVDVDFATAEAAEKALELDYTRLMNHPVKVGIAPGEGEHFPNRSLSIQFQNCEDFQPLTVYVVGFNTSLAEEKIKASLHNHFKSCGEIARISLPRNRDSGAIKGHAYLDFKDLDGYKKALQLDQTVIGDHWVSVEKAKPVYRRDNQDLGGGRGNYHVGGRDGLNHRHHNQDVGGGRGSYQVGGRDEPSYRHHNQIIGGGRGGYHVGGRDEASYRRDNQGMGGGRGSYHVGGRDEASYRRDNQGMGGGRGSYHVGGRGGGDYGGGRGCYHVGGRDGGNYIRDNQGMGGDRGSYHVGGRGGGDYGGRVGWGRSHGAERHWTANTKHL